MVKRFALIAANNSFTLTSQKRRMRNVQLKNKIYLTLTCCFTLCGCSKEENKQLANPASLYCVEQGGKLILAIHGDGGEYGICFFEDNRQCEEWALFRKECPVGGVKVTGYTKPESKYCAIRGGQVLNNETQCKLPSGKICSAKDLYNGADS